MGCGASVPCNILHKTNTAAALGAAILIQRWFRRHQARLEVRRRTAWRIFHRIELADEADQLRLYNFFGSLIDQVKQTEMAEETKKIGDSTVWKLETPTKKNRWMNCSASLPPEVPPTYTGPQLSFPITPPQAAALLIAFKNNQLHWLLALQLLREGRRKLYQEPGVRQATTNYPGHLTVCGDLHGQLEDLLLIFHKNGLPSPERKYIFNGDFVDRGGRSLELLLTLLRVYERDPHQVQDNLGTLATGMKFLNAGSHVAYAATRLFASLPLATVVNRRVLVLHGGLSSNIRLRALHSLPRHQFLSVLRPPVQMDEKGQVSTKFRDWKQLMAVLWSDPTPKAGESDNLARGGGCCFGPDVTLSVLRHHNLSLLIRSHECVPRGFAYQHGNMVLTVFSASNYFAPGSNLGAYVCLGYDLVPNCVQFQTGRQNLCPSSPHQCVSLVEQDAVKALREKLFTHRPQLTAAFMERDPQCTGILHVGTWAEAVGSVLGLDLPWRRLRQHLALPAPGGGVYYHSCFQDLSLPQFNNTAESSLIEKLYSHKKHLETVFHLLDQDHSGLLSFAEFRTAWRLALSSQPGLSTNDNEEQVLKLAQSVDFNRDGAIDFNEFLEAFRLLDSRFTHPSTTNTLTHGKACTSHLEKQTNKAELE